MVSLYGGVQPVDNTPYSIYCASRQTLYQRLYLVKKGTDMPFKMRLNNR